MNVNGPIHSHTGHSVVLYSGVAWGWQVVFENSHPFGVLCKFGPSKRLRPYQITENR